MAQLARRKLQGKCYQIPESAFGHGVLIGEEPILGIETELMFAFHGSIENHASQFASGGRRNCRIKEGPNVAALPGTGTFQGSWHAQFLARLKEGLGVLPPGLLIEVPPRRNQHVSSGRSGRLARFSPLWTGIEVARLRAECLVCSQAVFDNSLK